MSEERSNASNQLSRAASPYLRSAADQPVDWMEWGPAAFTRAQAEDKPILLDIGAAWCHWCHVLDRESYENSELAALINHFYVAVKVDRDERPDVDTRYQTAVSALTGQGGWPLTGFLLPDGRPFYGGTYFPPEDSMGRPGFRRVLESVASAYRTNRKDLEQTAEGLSGAIAQAETFANARGAWHGSLADLQVKGILERYEPTYGGFGRAPKFPHSSAIDLILERYQATNDAPLLAVVQTTLEKMARGGVCDQLGGGFHRYSVDERWLVPHFEKMSYDNSELLKNYLHAYQVTRDPLFRATARGIIFWVGRVLSDRERGGFYASQDADITLHDDGDYFTWTLEELRAALPGEDAQVMELYYDVEASGEMQHNPAKNVLWVARDAQAIAQALNRDADDVKQTIERARTKLLEVRDARTAPFVDTTLYTNWNAMFVSAYFEAAGTLEGEVAQSCFSFARRTLDRLLAEGWDERRGFAHRLGGAWLDGTLDDQATMVAALLDGFDATLDRRYFAIAEATMDLVLEKYADKEGGGFFDRSSDAPPMGGLEIRRKPVQDSPTPAGNPLAIIALERMYGYTGKSEYREAARAALEAFAGKAPEFGLFAATYGLATVLHARHPLQILVTGPAQDETAAQLERRARSFYRYGKSVLRLTPEVSAEQLPPTLAEIVPHVPGDRAQAMLCAGGTCYPPVSDPNRLAELLASFDSAAEVAGGD